MEKRKKKLSLISVKPRGTRAFKISHGHSLTCFLSRIIRVDVTGPRLIAPGGKPRPRARAAAVARAFTLCEAASIFPTSAQLTRVAEITQGLRFFFSRLFYSHGTAPARQPEASGSRRRGSLVAGRITWLSTSPQSLSLGPGARQSVSGKQRRHWPERNKRRSPAIRPPSALRRNQPAPSAGGAVVGFQTRITSPQKKDEKDALPTLGNRQPAFRLVTLGRAVCTVLRLCRCSLSGRPPRTECCCDSGVACSARRFANSGSRVHCSQCRIVTDRTTFWRHRCRARDAVCCC